jgi:hypothetical protein
MRIIQINVIDAEFLKRLVQGLPDISRRAVDDLPGWRSSSKLGREENLAAFSGTLEPIARSARETT